MAMKNFTFVWKIKDFSYYWQKDNQVEIISPEFELNNAAGISTWQLLFSDRRVHDNRPISRNDKSIILYLHRVDFDGPDLITLNVNMSFVKADKSLVHWTEKRGIEETFQKNQMKSYLKVNGNEILLLKRDELLIEDVLTVRCKMWNNADKLSKVEGQCLARTLLETEHMHFIAVVDKFSDLIPGLKRAVRINSASMAKPKFFMNICLLDDGKLNISISIEAYSIYLCNCILFILDNSWNWQKWGQNSEWRKFGEVWEFKLPLDFKTLVKYEKYLMKDKITLKCDITYTTEAEPRRIHTTLYGLDTPEILQQIPFCVKTPPVVKKENPLQVEEGNLKSRTTLTDDLISLYNERTLCDTKLCTGTETFPAHRAVLSARSPVFKKMFMTDMRENSMICVDIQDLNADTVRKLLMFMYTDAVDEMDWQTAMELYFAADKYDIVSLKDMCSSFLKFNLTPSNCCDVLLLSDMHQDADLKQFVQDYIVSKDQDVFGSDGWKMFVANHIQLAADTMCLKYTKKGMAADIFRYPPKHASETIF